MLTILGRMETGVDVHVENKAPGMGAAAWRSYEMAQAIREEAWSGEQ